MLLCLTSPAVNLTKSKVKAMRKQALHDLCERVGISVVDCKKKADYVEKLLAHMEQQPGQAAAPVGSKDAPVLDKPKVCSSEMCSAVMNAMPTSPCFETGTTRCTHWRGHLVKACCSTKLFTPLEISCPRPLPCPALSLLLLLSVQLSRFSMKNMLNAMTDLQRMQHMLLGTTEVIRVIRSGLRMRAFLGVFKRAAATAQRR